APGGSSDGADRQVGPCDPWQQGPQGHRGDRVLARPLAVGYQGGDRHSPGGWHLPQGQEGWALRQGFRELCRCRVDLRQELRSDLRSWWSGSLKREQNETNP